MDKEPEGEPDHETDKNEQLRGDPPINHADEPSHPRPRPFGALPPSVHAHTRTKRSGERLLTFNASEMFLNLVTPTRLLPTLGGYGLWSLYSLAGALEMGLILRDDYSAARARVGRGLGVPTTFRTDQLRHGASS